MAIPPTDINPGWMLGIGWVCGFTIYVISGAGSSVYTAKTKYRNFETNIPRKGISGSQSQFPNSCVCERIICYSDDGSAFSAGGNMWTDPGNI